MVYEILKTEVFDKKFSRLDHSTQSRLKKIREILKDNPYIGKPLDFEFF